jgi:hypothetical protein
MASGPQRPRLPGRRRPSLRGAGAGAGAGGRQRLRLAVAGSAVVLLVAVIVAATRSGSPPPPPLPGTGQVPRSGDPFAYSPSREAAFVERATAGSGQVLFTKSPGGALATADRVAAYRGLIDAATRGTGIDPALVEGLVFVESAGRPDVVAGADPSAAAGLTQILADTGHSLLGMHIDLARSRKLLSAIGNASSPSQVKRLLTQLAKVDDRFDARKALAATVRYLKIAEQKFGRQDLAVVSYHMGIGNLQQVLSDYDGGQPVPYADLYFDTAPDHHAGAFRLLAGFGDQSSLYFWRVLGAAQIMRLYRSDRAALKRLNGLETEYDSSALVLHPPDRMRTLADPNALSAAYAARTLVPLPANAAQLGLAYAPSMGAQAHRLGAPAALYRGLAPVALDLLVELAGRVRVLSGFHGRLTVHSTVLDRRYQSLLGIADQPAATGYTFEISRRYGSPAQAQALQAMLDRLQALNLIAWVRHLGTIQVTVAGDASKVIGGGV